MRENYRNLKVAVLGGGTVGSEVARRLLSNREELGRRVGAELDVIGVAVRDANKKRKVSLPKKLITTDAKSLVVQADIVVELMGGIEPARELILLALESGADVITANKALLAAHGPELFDAASKVGAQLYYEAAVAGAIPIIRPLRDSLAGDEVNRILGTPAMRERVTAIGGVPVPMSPEQFAAKMADDGKRFGAIVRERRITGD